MAVTIETHTCLVDGVCDYCIDRFPPTWPELGIRVHVAFDDEARRVNGTAIWVKALASGGEWIDSRLFWRLIGVLSL